MKYNDDMSYREDVSVEAVFSKLGGVVGAKRFLADELTLIEKLKSEPTLEPPLDFIVRVGRSVKPIYPDWFKKLTHPEFECAGPTEYNLQTVLQWLHDNQKRGSVVGNTIYKHLQKGNAFASCLNLQDGLAIQAKGIAVFRKLFAGKVVFLYGSVAQCLNDGLHVPCLYEKGDEVVEDWSWLCSDWDSHNPALRFGK